MSTLYQLTAAAAQMCTPVPAAAPDGWLDRLDHWQTLAGNGIGGFLGVAGAWIVAVSIRRRERRIAAGMVLPDLQQLAAAGDALDQWLAVTLKVPVGGWSLGEAVRATSYAPTAAVNRLTERRPLLFALHTPVIGQLSDIDERLYSHLFQCEMTHRMFEEGIAAQQALQDEFMDAPMNGSARVRARGTVPSSVQLHSDWQRCVEHATLAAYYLDRLVFSSWPCWFQRLRMKLRPNDFDRRSVRLIKTGELLRTAPQQPPAGPPPPAQT